jgi:hypothetical protein
MPVLSDAIGSPAGPATRPGSAHPPTVRSTDQRSRNSSTAARTTITSGTGRRVAGSGSSRCSGPWSTSTVPENSVWTAR